MKLGFDASALNWLHDDSACEDLIRALLEAGEVQISFLNVLELARTPDQFRRESLLTMVRHLSANKRPLEDIHELLEVAVEAYENKRPVLKMADAASSRLSWGMLNRPTNITKDLLDELRNFYNEREDEFQQVHAEMREEIDKLVDSEEIERIDRASDLLRRYTGNLEFLAHMVNVYYRAYSGRTLLASEVWACLESLPWLASFLTGWGFSIFKKGISAQGFGKRSNAGILDQYYAIYLPNYTRFVTADNKQRVLLKFCSHFVGLDCSVVSYNCWRNTMII